MLPLSTKHRVFGALAEVVAMLGLVLVTSPPICTSMRLRGSDAVSDNIGAASSSLAPHTWLVPAISIRMHLLYHVRRHLAIIRTPLAGLRCGDCAAESPLPRCATRRGCRGHVHAWRGAFPLRCGPRTTRPIGGNSS